jgi:hypothetical protein
MTLYNIKGTLSGSGRLGGGLSGKGHINADLTTPQLIYPGIYQGPTTVTPGHEDQVLPTSNLLLTSDITVLKIPEPEFVEEIYDSGDIKLADTSFNTWTPSTTASTIRSSQTAGTFSAHMGDYEYLIKWEFGFNAVTVSGATLKAQLLYEGADQWQVLHKRPSSWANIQAEHFNGNTCSTYYTIPFIRYYNTSGALTYTHSISYGIYPVIVASTFASSTADNTTVTLKTTSVSARCNATYFATARAPQLDKDLSTFRIVGKLYRTEIPGEVRKMYEDFYERMLDEQ